MGILKPTWLWLRRKLNLGLFLLGVHPKSIIVVDGWNRSFRMNQAVNRQGEPIPWCTYPFIHFIETRLNKKLRMFEYGCGNSTLYYTQRVAEVISVENDRLWAQTTSAKLPSNGHVVYRDKEEEYVEEIIYHGQFDIVVIDGIIGRVTSVPFACKALTEQGVIIFDNSDWAEFSEGCRLLREQGFRELPFYGLAPITFVPTQTSIFYKTGNCLGI